MSEATVHTVSPTDPGYPIQPHHIDITRHFFGATGNMEGETSARWIVRFCQHRNKGWQPFVLSDLDAFYQQYWPGESIWLNNAVRFLTFDGKPHTSGTSYNDETVIGITHRFVAACWTASPQGTARAEEAGA